MEKRIRRNLHAGIMALFALYYVAFTSARIAEHPTATRLGCVVLATIVFLAMYGTARDAWKASAGK